MRMRDRRSEARPEAEAFRRNTIPEGQVSMLGLALLGSIRRYEQTGQGSREAGK